MSGSTAHGSSSAHEIETELSSGGELADEVELVPAETLEVVVDEAALPKESGEDVGQDGVSEVELAVDLLPPPSQPAFQLPQLGRLFDPAGRVAQVPGEVITTTESGCPRCLAFGHLGEHRPWSPVLLFLDIC